MSASELYIEWSKPASYVDQDTMGIGLRFLPYYNGSQKNNFKSGLRTIRVMKIPGSEFSSINWIIDIVYVGTWIGNGVVSS